MNKRERIIELAWELLKLRERQAVMEAELDGLIGPERGPGRPQTEGSLALQIEKILQEAKGASLDVGGLATLLHGAPRKHISAALSYMLKKDKVERVEKGTYRLKQ